MYRRQVLGTLGCAILWALTPAMAKTPEEHALKVGKRGEITLTQPTKVANQLLQPATYIIQHRDSGSGHFVRFLQMVKLEFDDEREVDAPRYSYAEQDNVGELKCRMEPTSAPVLETTAYIVTENGAPRITKVAIKGESALHVF